MRYALRTLARSPGFTLVALATLALGIGVNTTAFTVLDRLLLQSLPFKDAGRLVEMWTTTGQSGYMPETPADYFDQRDGLSSLENVAVYTPLYQVTA
jgi:hypothetical protein